MGRENKMHKGPWDGRIKDATEHVKGDRVSAKDPGKDERSRSHGRSFIKS
jgi:hypothetical protein